MTSRQFDLGAGRTVLGPTSGINWQLIFQLPHFERSILFTDPFKYGVVGTCTVCCCKMSVIDKTCVATVNRTRGLKMTGTLIIYFSLTLSQLSYCNYSAPTGNRTQGKCLEGTYVTTTPLVRILLPEPLFEGPLIWSVKNKKVMQLGNWVRYIIIVMWLISFLGHNIMYLHCVLGVSLLNTGFTNPLVPHFSIPVKGLFERK